jgi:hypothetical protein
MEECYKQLIGHGAIVVGQKRHDPPIRLFFMHQMNTKKNIWIIAWKQLFYLLMLSCKGEGGLIWMDGRYQHQSLGESRARAKSNG